MIRKYIDRVSLYRFFFLFPGCIILIQCVWFDPEYKIDPVTFLQISHNGSKIEPSTYVHSFGTISLYSSLSADFRITNNGRLAVKISSIQPDEGSGEDFKINGNTSGRLFPGESAVFQLTANPTSYGLKKARVSILLDRYVNKLSFSVSCQTHSSILFVSQFSGNNLNSGLSPSLAKQTIQSAIDAAGSGDAIYTEEGNYNEEIVFKNNIFLYGGFNRTFSKQDPLINVSLITASASPAVTFDSSITTRETVLDGFTVRGADYNSAGSTDIYTVYNNGGLCTITHNRIFGGDHLGSTQSDTVGIYCYNGDMVITGNTIIAGNTDTAGDDNNSFGINIQESSGQIINNIIRGGSTASGLNISNPLFISSNNGIYTMNVLNNTLIAGNGYHSRGIDYYFEGGTITFNIRNNIILGTSSSGGNHYGVREALNTVEPANFYHNLIYGFLTALYFDENLTALTDINDINALTGSQNNISLSPGLDINDCLTSSSALSIRQGGVNQSALMEFPSGNDGFKIDRFLKRRTIPWSIGAHEYD